MQNKWNIGFSSWILNDGNYPVFYPEEQVEFACWFYADEFKSSESSSKSANLLGGAQYCVNAEVVYIDSEIFVIDFGILAYTSLVTENALLPGNDKTGRFRIAYDFQKSLKPGHMISAKLYLGIDYYPYFERHCDNLLVPPMIYKWHLNKIEADFRKLVQLEGRVYGYTEPEPDWQTVDSTYVGGGIVEFLLHCTRSVEPPHRDGQRLRD